MPDIQEYKTEEIPMEQIFSDDDFNCRGKIVPIDVIDLARSIKEKGLQFPIAVQPFTHPSNPKIKYRIVAGHRRFMAFKVNREDTIPAMVKGGLSELDARLLNLTENLQRENLNILQEARALIPFKKANWQQETIAAKTGTSRGWVQVRLMLLELPEEIQAEAAAGMITQTQIRQLYSLPTREEQFAAVRTIKERKERGERAPIIANKVPPKPNEKKERKQQDLMELQEYIQDQVGNNIVTRVLGWATGYVSNLEIHRDLREFFKDKNIPYEIPRDLISQL